MAVADPEAVRLRPARPEDSGLILGFIRELAEYERLANEVVATEEGIRETLFGDGAVAHCILAFVGEQPAGFALWFHNYSTFLGRPGLYLEDLFVRPAFRRRGIGRRLLAELARLARDGGCGRFEWAVLDWNAPSIAFYKSLGATALDAWTVYRLTGEALDRLAARAGR
ncbi:MAG TPA: GNAT family N-acetyltransferase [Gammaproteobacteria bacterium]|jgi:GNAT superfamily N-acetyltransferase